LEPGWRAGVTFARAYPGTPSRPPSTASQSSWSPTPARALLHDSGFTTHFSQVICGRVSDEPGGLMWEPAAESLPTPQLGELQIERARRPERQARRAAIIET